MGNYFDDGRAQDLQQFVLLAQSARTEARLGHPGGPLAVRRDFAGLHRWLISWGTAARMTHPELTLPPPI
jgi:hypothetical protein